MKKFLSKVGNILLSILGFCVVGFMLVNSFFNTCTYDVTKDVERKAEEERDREEQEYQEMTVWADCSTMYYHSDEHCKGVHDIYTEEMPLYKAERDGYRECKFCW